MVQTASRPRYSVPRTGRTAAVQAATDADGLRLELVARERELRDDVAAMTQPAELFVRIAGDYSPMAYQAAMGLRHRLRRMSARLEGGEG